MSIFTILVEQFEASNPEALVPEVEKAKSIGVRAPSYTKKDNSEVAEVAGNHS
ncbi:MAG: hypothetical protein ACLFVG_09115 [Candidatus Aminicenantes bacterium]